MRRRLEHRHTCCAAMLLCLAMLWAQPAAAEPRVALQTRDGQYSRRMRAALERALGSATAITVVGDDAVERAAHSSRASLETEEGRASVGRSLAISAFVEGRARKRGRWFVLELKVHDGATGGLRSERSVRARRVKLSSALQAWLLNEIRKPSPGGEEVADAGQLEAPDPGAAERSPAPDPDAGQLGAPDPGPDATVEPKPHMLELELSTHLVGRGHAFESGSQTPSQQLGLSPGARLGARWYPWAQRASGIAAHLGLALQAQWMLPAPVNWGASRFMANSFALSAALRARLPLHVHELGVFAGPGLDHLDISDSQYGERPRTLAASYSFLRIGGDAQLQLSRAITLDLRAAYLLLHAYGQLLGRAWFPHARARYGLEAELGASWAMSSVLGVRVGVGLVRYLVALHPAAGDPGVLVHTRVARTFDDQALYGLLGLTLQL